MAQFKGKQGTNWWWIILIIIVLLAAAAVVVYLNTVNPDLFSFLQR